MRSIKKKVLGITVYELKTSMNKDIIKIFNIPIIKKVMTNKSRIYFIFGIKFFSKKIRKTSKILLDEKNIDFFLSKPEVKKVLVVKTDSIGDYILIRNFFKEIKNSEDFCNAEITLLCSSAVKNICSLDNDVINKFLFIKHKSWREHPEHLDFYVRELFKQGLEKSYDTILFPSFNRREFENLNKSIVSQVFAKEIIINNGDYDVNISFDELNNGVECTRTIFNPNGLRSFEFINNKYFFERALARKINIDSPYIEPDFIEKNYIAPCENYVVINPCSQVPFKMWSKFNYARLIQWVVKEKNMNVILICQKHEQEYCEDIRKLSGGQCSILVDLPFREVINLLYHARMYIGNDSGIFHLSVALKQKTIVIVNGDAYFRFTRYPQLEFLRVAIAQETLQYLSEKVENNYEKSAACFLNINMVTLKDVQDNFLDLIENTSK